MITYLKLVHLEISRFRIVLLSLMALTFVLQVGSILFSVNQELGFREENPQYYENGNVYGREKMSLAWTVFTNDVWYSVPIAISIVVLLGYMLMIWYRDWFGRQTLIYRLLMLPGARFRVYAAKLTALLLFVFAMVGFQMLLLPIEHGLFNAMVPADLRVHSYPDEVIRSSQLLSMLLPLNAEQFVYSYGLGIIGVTAVFTGILLERCFKWIGLIASVVYLAACWFIILLPLMDSGYFYPFEYYLLELAACALVLIASIAISGWLLAKKITV